MVSINNNVGMIPLSAAKNCQPLAERNNKIAFAGVKHDDVEISDEGKAEIKEKYDKAKQGSEYIKNMHESLDKNNKLSKSLKPLLNIAGAAMMGTLVFSVAKAIYHKTVIEPKREQLIQFGTGVVEGLVSAAKDLKANLKSKFGDDTHIGKVVNFCYDKAKEVKAVFAKNGENIRINEKLVDKIKDHSTTTAVTAELKKSLKEEAAGEIKTAIKDVSSSHLAAEGVVKPAVNVAGTAAATAAGTYAAFESADGDPGNTMEKVDAMVEKVGVKVK
ncbi:MAG: hypothetical protein WCK67_09440 [bacterium]